MNSKVKQGDVWLADAVFKGTHQTKQRPVIIVGNELALDVDVCPVTSQHARNRLVDYLQIPFQFPPSSLSPCFHR